MKIALIGINSKFIHINLAIRYLKAYTNDLDYDCKIMEFSINDRLERILREILDEKPDIAAFSCYIWNLEYVLKIADLIKLIDKNIKILYGGPEVSYESKSFLENNPGDYLIEGEGEETFREFVYNIINKKEIFNIKGLYTKYGNNVIYGGKRNLMDINKLIFPYDDDMDLNNKIVYYESSRGCPFNCKYCLSSTIRGVRFLNIERVKKELKFFIDKKVKLVKFVDRTFNCSREFSMEIWNYLINLDTNTTFHFEISADILNDKQINLLKKAPKGRFQFEIGVQTTNDNVLKNINRYVKFEKIKNQVLEIKKIGSIKQHLDLIAGLPGENFESFKKSFNDLYSIYPDEIQLGFLKVLKGSLMKEEAEMWGITYSPYPPYEVLKTRDISYDEIQILKRTEEIVDKYFNSQKFKSIINYFIPKFKTPFDFYSNLGEFFNNKGYFKRNLSSVDYYKVFLEFNSEVLKEDNEVLKEIIKFEYLKYNRKKWIPEFLTRYFNKKLEKKLKIEQKNNTIKIPFYNYHLEIFHIDIFKFLYDNKLIKGNYYLIFDEDNPDNILDITELVYNENLL
ncbi:B12-binding domain-containing radical SAM protein [Clostridium prolinivorans]|uniref:B12-binding domain-containing radical SAM protein n=1 Tax=Clostridium prolinivorans TaxID=2769420 RepID=UPI000FD723A9|nr:B12-binding domain-containing radical SAM protein [Clostridium prolinivorans]